MPHRRATVLFGTINAWRFPCHLQRVDPRFRPTNWILASRLAILRAADATCVNAVFELVQQVLAFRRTARGTGGTGGY